MVFIGGALLCFCRRSVDRAPDMRFGTDLRGEGLERRLIAILAADVVGCTRLMGEDEVGTLER